MNQDILQKLQNFEIEGKQLQKTLIERLNQASRNKDLGHAATDILGSMWLPHGTKRSGKQFFKKSLSNRKQIIEKEAADVTDKWLDDIVEYLKTVSKLTAKITRKGNSPTLIKKFNSAKTAVSAQTKIIRGLVALKILKNYDLVHNNELKEILQGKKLRKAKTSQYKHLSGEAKKLLKDHPSALESYLGAIERVEKGGLDANRQCLSSCRTCLENVVKKESKKDWRLGLPFLVPSKTRQKTVKNTYQFLSAYGSHGPENPNNEDAKSGLEQTISAIRLILSPRK